PSSAFVPAPRSLLLSIRRRPPTPTLFPYTTLFRSHPAAGRHRPGADLHVRGDHGQRPLAVHAAQRRPRDVHSAQDVRHGDATVRSEEHTSELQSRFDLVCRLLLEKKKKKTAKRQNN